MKDLHLDIEGLGAQALNAVAHASPSGDAVASPKTPGGRKKVKRGTSEAAHTGIISKKNKHSNENDFNLFIFFLNMNVRRAQPNY